MLTFLQGPLSHRAQSALLPRCCRHSNLWLILCPLNPILRFCHFRISGILEASIDTSILSSQSKVFKPRTQGMNANMQAYANVQASGGLWFVPTKDTFYFFCLLAWPYIVAHLCSEHIPEHGDYFRGKASHTNLQELLHSKHQLFVTPGSISHIHKFLLKPPHVVRRKHRKHGLAGFTLGFLMQKGFLAVVVRHNVCSY